MTNTGLCFDLGDKISWCSTSQRLEATAFTSTSIGSIGTLCRSCIPHLLYSPVVKSLLRERLWGLGSIIVLHNPFQPPRCIFEFERGKLLQASLLVSEVFVEVEKTVHIVAYELLPVDRLRSNNKLPHQPPRL